MIKAVHPSTNRLCEYVCVYISLFSSTCISNSDLVSSVQRSSLNLLLVIFEFHFSVFVFVFTFILYYILTKIFLDCTSATISQIELRISALATRTKMKDKISVLIFNVHLFSIISSYFL